jgi:hypothetical protein
MPPSALLGLTPSQFEQILAHEIAHIRRHDYVVNLIQSVLETLFFYHPAVWWVSDQIRIERENACDDLAIIFTGDPISYSRALVKLERIRIEDRSFAMGAGGGSLAHRIQRIMGIGMRPDGFTKIPWIVGALSIVLVALLVHSELSVLSENVSTAARLPNQVYLHAAAEPESDGPSDQGDLSNKLSGDRVGDGSMHIVQTMEKRRAVPFSPKDTLPRFDPGDANVDLMDRNRQTIRRAKVDNGRLESDRIVHTECLSSKAKCFERKTDTWDTKAEVKMTPIHFEVKMAPMSIDMSSMKMKMSP